MHNRSRGVYGSPKNHRDLVAEGEQWSINRVARLMRSSDIQSKLARKFVVTTNSRNTLEPAPDLLRRDFVCSQPNKAWVTDTTFVPTRKGWLYLATVLDLYSRKVIGWAMSERNDSELVEKLAGALLSIETIRQQSFRHCVEPYSWQHMVPAYDTIFGAV